jgi:hypothetical protein
MVTNKMDKLHQFINNLGLKLESCFVVNSLVEHLIIRGSNSDCFSVYVDKKYCISPSNIQGVHIVALQEIKDESVNRNETEQSMYTNIDPEIPDKFSTENLEKIYAPKLRVSTEVSNTHQGLVNQVRRLNICISHTKYRFSIISDGMFVDSLSGDLKAFKIGSGDLSFLRSIIPTSKRDVCHKIIVQTSLTNFYSRGNSIDSEQSDIKYKLYDMLQKNFDHMMDGIAQLEQNIEYIKDMSTRIYDMSFNYITYSKRFDSVNKLMETSRVKSMIKEREYRTHMSRDDSINSDLSLAEERARYADTYNKIRDMKKLASDTEKDLRNKLDELFVVSDEIGFTTNILTRQISENFKKLGTVL